MENNETKLEIIYCQPCGYQPKAVELANRILSTYGQSLNKKLLVSLKPSDNGVFDVSFNNELIFSRYKERRLPEAKEIVDAIGADIENR
jgi:selT/selW/selH-like putative selenoprotein